ncbi:MAG TPA: hypothetical protein PLZ51_10645, partial [Aggregatilineales bacterium]|nr:hypothetical protein [Aggregatilineales bacterium]
GSQPFTDRIMEQHNIIPQGMSSDEIAQKWGISRADVDQIGYESHMRATNATQKGWMSKEITPMAGVDETGNEVLVTQDQGFRPSANVEKMATLQPAFT